MTSTLETIRDIEVREVTLHAIVEGDWLIPIDQSGNRIGKKVRASKVGGRLEPNVLSDWRWAKAIQRMVQRALSSSYDKQYDPWTTRIKSLACSLRVRRRLPQRMPHSRQRFQCYSTSTWEESVHRLWEQAHNRQRKALLTGWDRWTATVSRNHNRKGNQTMQTKRSVTTTQIKQLIESQNYRCALTNRPLTPETASLDHKQPISRGGTHEVANLWVVEHFVNTAKGSLTVDEFVSMCRDVVRHQDAITTPKGADPMQSTLEGAGQTPMTPLMSV